MWPHEPAQAAGLYHPSHRFTLGLHVPRPLGDGLPDDPAGRKSHTMRTTIIASALAGVALIAGASAASANVAVDNGSGYVGKGDVQSALG